MITLRRSSSLAVLCALLPLSFALPREAPAQEAAQQQQSGGKAGQAEDEASDAAAPAAASEGPFSNAINRLSTVMGSMHFLSTLCADPKSNVWRDEMSAFLKAQKPNETDRKRMIASFNSGYRAFESTYRHCTPAARIAHNRYREEGVALSRDMLTRYGN
ncbi:TIGR02301 family protein [Fulvimarina endophytica]|uniref:TIGR02301 family protein n=2 Tax=Fulvimarina endophytica TaxID=2293836 RepID=A0A371XBD4_9HYPH|nr:TIGR02301 family protein [Fulvimarina endophytica]